MSRRTIQEKLLKLQRIRQLKMINLQLRLLLLPLSLQGTIIRYEIDLYIVVSDNDSFSFHEFSKGGMYHRITMVIK